MTAHNTPLVQATGVGTLPDFVRVPAGELPTGQETAGFGLSVLPVTVGQYWSYLVDQQLLDVPRPSLHSFARQHGTGLRTGLAGAVVLDQELDDLPVTGVTWRGAVAYCTWLGARTRTHCRVPTAAEWQYAAAGPQRSRWSLGDTFDRAVYAPQADAPRPVGTTGANAFGLRDMTGNVFEWCADELTAPSGARLGSRVIKGGSYTVRNPESFENTTAFTADELSTLPYIGFRVLRTGGQ
ncbi:formylglycine-generating enzyme family protein [Streptomyces sp. NPDC058371]|uniref:formylglycine-generating enzyme family protein n=1 Tax=Streptomyces sp. NPDC058371 TaxID=3346463 RepID=UPI0036607364